MIEETKKTTCAACGSSLNIYYSMGMKFEEPCKQCMLGALSDNNSSLKSKDETFIEDLSDNEMDTVINSIYGRNKKV